MREFISLVRLAYSAERAAAFAYQGHAASLKNPLERIELAKIESDEWLHRRHLKRILDRLDRRPSRRLEAKYYVIGKLIGFSCHVIGWFMPMYFAGRLESGNVMEYVQMEILARRHGFDHELECIREMAAVEKEHEIYFLEKAKTHWAIAIFPRFFAWGPDRSFNALRPDPGRANAAAGRPGLTEGKGMRENQSVRGTDDA
jgi:demethoxyubiquinone hydroxylase (CLK1/Coq7/Cat5 family)